MSVSRRVILLENKSHNWKKKCPTCGVKKGEACLSVFGDMTNHIHLERNI